MRVGRMVTGTTLDDVVRGVVEAERDGFDTAWRPQIFDWDALTALALAARETSAIELGTAVIPIHTRHPLSLAAGALTLSAASGGRFTLGIGPSHKLVVEDMWGLSYDQPRAYTRDYLAALLPSLAGQPVDSVTERVTSRAPALATPGAPTPSVLIAALAPKMLELAGSACDGTVTMWTGLRTLSEHVVPLITRAAEEAGRPAPRIVAGMVVSVTDDVTTTRAQVQEEYAGYGELPAYRRMLDREGAAQPADVAVIGTAEYVAEQLAEFAAAGATDLCVLPFGTPEEQRETCKVVTAAASGPR